MRQMRIKKQQKKKKKEEKEEKKEEEKMQFVTDINFNQWLDQNFTAFNDENQEHVRWMNYE